MAGLTGSAPQFALRQADRLSPHEEVDEADVKRLADEIRDDGLIYQPVLVDRATDVILDGHHRFHALGELGCRLIPCYRVDYLEPTILVETWDAGGPMDKRRLLRRALDGELYPIKTSRHRTLFELPARGTPIDRLRRDPS